MYIIAKDGSGDFTSIQQAVDAVPPGDRAPVILLVRPGVYEERVVVHKDNLRIVGQSRTETVITARGCAKDPDENGQERGTFLSATFMVTGHNVEVENLTIRNDAGDGRDVGQAVAVYAAGDRGVWRNVRMIAHQDTLFCGPLMPKVADFVAPRQGRAEMVPSVGDCPMTHSRQYFEDCLIRGDIDFIFGPYRCWFERCTLVMNERGGFYTAANTPEGQPYGMVFRQCALTGDCENGLALLGRPWRKYAQTVFLSCEMDEHVSPAGFADWDEVRLVTERYAEFGTRGARADQSTRHPRQKRMTAEEARCVTLPQVIGGADGWHPERRTPTWFLCGDSTMADYPLDRSPMAGWGQKLQALLPQDVFVENCAVCGRSSKSFFDENRLLNIACCLRSGDRLIVSFSHNDEKPDLARHTDPDTTFPEYLGKYIETARLLGAEPVLATPVARRHFDAQGRLLATHGPYPEALRKTARRLAVPLADLEAATMALFQELGPEGTKDIFCHVPAGHPNYPEGLSDNSHLQERGAVRVAELFLKALSGAPVPKGSFEEAREGAAELSAREDDVLRS